MRRRVVLCAIPILTWSQLGAQQRDPGDAGMGAILGVNVLIGAATGGIGNAVAGRSFLSGAAKGASGGIFIFAGKKFISQRGAVAAWGGRQLAAVGTSQVRNGAAGRPLLSELVFPLGLTRVYVRTADRLRVSMRLDLSALVSTAIMANRDGTSFELKESISNGALMFSEEFGSDSVAGSHLSGAIRVDRVPPVTSDGSGYVWSAVAAHELIHATQYDFLGIALGEPLEAKIFNRTRAGRKFKKLVDPGILTPLWSIMNAAIPRSDRPWEREAHSLSSGQ